MITVTLVDGTTINVAYIEDAYSPDTQKRRVTMRIKDTESYAVDNLATVLISQNIGTLVVSGKTDKIITGMAALESLSWRISEYDNVAEITITLSE